MQFASGQHRLEQIGRIHRAFRRAGAHDCMQLIDEQQNLPFGACISLRTAFNRSSNSPRNFAPATSDPMSSAMTFLVFSPSGTSPLTMRMRQPFDNGGFSDARFTDEHRIVLGSAGQDLNHTPDFFVATDDGIQLALPGQSSQVAAIFFQRLVGTFRVLTGDTLITAHLLQSRTRAVPSSGRVF